MTQKVDRRIINRQRRALSDSQRRTAANQAKTFLNRLNTRLPKRAKVALYIDDFGELPTQPILDWCRRMKFDAYLPVIYTLGKDSRQMRFIRIKHTHLTNVRTVRHAFGMKEPKQRHLVRPDDLDVVFFPLVAADENGNRMGMGGGFYDTTFTKSYQYSSSKNPRRHPLRVGWCYEFQVVEQLDTQPWDVPLNALITPSKIRWFS